MNEYLRTSLSGWAGVILFGSGLMMPYLLRGVPKSGTPYLRRLWPHYWLGYLAFFVLVAHAWLAMGKGIMQGINPAGVWIASIAMLIMLWQIGSGLMLRNALQSGRRNLRRVHFWTMASSAGLIVVHVALNRP